MKKIKRKIKKFVYRIRGIRNYEELIDKGLVIGKKFNCMANVNIDDSHCWLIKIGDNVTIAPNVHILAHDASSKMLIGYTKIGKVTIGNSVFIGAGSIILPNTIIEDNVIVGAGSVVTKKLESNYVYAGNPCRKIMTVDEYRKKCLAQMNDNVFDSSYTERKNVDKQKKQEMIDKLENNIGFIE